MAEAVVDFETREAYLIVDDAKFPGEAEALAALRSIGKDGKFIARATHASATD